MTMSTFGCHVEQLENLVIFMWTYMETVRGKDVVTQSIERLNGYRAVKHWIATKDATRVNRWHSVHRKSASKLG